MQAQTVESPTAEFVANLLDQLHNLQETVRCQEARLRAVECRPPALAAGSISSEQLAFEDGTAVHWAIGRPAGVYVGNELQPLAPPYSEVVIARGPLTMFVSDGTGMGFNVTVASEPGRITLGDLVRKVNEHVVTTVDHWSALEPFLGKTFWQLKQGCCGWHLKVQTDIPALEEGI